VISSTAFYARPPDLPPVPLMDMGFAITCSLARHRRPYHPVLVHRPAYLFHASFRPHLAVTPFRFARPSPPSGWSEDFHLQAVEHARRTRKKPRRRIVWASGAAVSSFDSLALSLPHFSHFSFANLRQPSGSPEAAPATSWIATLRRDVATSTEGPARLPPGPCSGPRGERGALLANDCHCPLCGGKWEDPHEPSICRERRDH
jgi:hypothetical protein